MAISAQTNEASDNASQQSHSVGRRCVIIGQSDRRAFVALRAWLRANAVILGDFVDVESALQNEQLLSDADLTIVMQSWSDEFTMKLANQLIGQTLFSRLFCCYSVACESDGRNRDVWPDALRIPVRLAPSVLERELRDVKDDEPAVPPTAAPDEIFAHRLGKQDDWHPSSALQNMNGAVISPDRTLRRTVSLSMKEQGLRMLDMPLISPNGQHRVRKKETSRGPVHIVVHDLDPWSGIVETSIRASRRMFPAASMLGMATMPDSGLTIEVADQQLAGIVPKMDLEHGLRWHIRQLLAR